ncbi:MAG: hypothetical protein IJJ86_04830 [Clostridia bacterium]|nr:hypothetical protein [Clostridia bacterium]
MKPLTNKERKTAKNLLRDCTEILPEGFRIDLSKDPGRWDAVSRAIGTKRLCAWVSSALSDAYEARYHKPFLFSERCMTFELKYHLNAYLCVKGLRRVRHVSTLLIPKRLLDRGCRSVELDVTDVYRLSQRFAFRYFFGVRRALKRTDRDPYAKKIGKTYFRIPFYRLFTGRRLQSVPDCGMLTVPEQGEEHAHGTDAR